MIPAQRRYPQEHVEAFEKMRSEIWDQDPFGAADAAAVESEGVRCFERLDM